MNTNKNDYLIDLKDSKIHNIDKYFKFKNKLNLKINLFKMDHCTSTNILYFLFLIVILCVTYYYFGFSFMCWMIFVLILFTIVTPYVALVNIDYIDINEEKPTYTKVIPTINIPIKKEDLIDHIDLKDSKLHDIDE